VLSRSNLETGNEGKIKLVQANVVYEEKIRRGIDPSLTAEKKGQT